MKTKKTFKSAVVAALTLALLAAIPLTFALAEDGEPAIDDVVIDDVLLDDAVIDDVEDEAADDSVIATFPAEDDTDKALTPEDEAITTFAWGDPCPAGGDHSIGSPDVEVIWTGRTDGNGNYGVGYQCHDVYCNRCEQYVVFEEPCDFGPNPVSGTSRCSICDTRYIEQCATHNLSNWRAYDYGDGYYHNRWCYDCDYYDWGPCEYQGSTICTICGHDARVCPTCNGQGSFTCGVSLIYDEYDWKCGFFGIECGSFVWLDLENDIQMGYCDCGCSTAADALEYAESENYLEYYEPGEMFFYGCNDDCNCVVICPDCPPPAPRASSTTRTAPRMGEDSALLTWVIVPMALLFVAGPVEMVISRRKAKNTNK